MKKAFYIIMSILVALLIVIDVSLLISGSAEAFPTAEQIEKGRLVYGLILLSLLAFEAFILTRIFKK
jgi:hypothetical protein